jgi:hypothetical protein
MRRPQPLGFAAESAVAMLYQFLFQSLLHVCSSQLARFVRLDQESSIWMQESTAK